MICAKITFFFFFFLDFIDPPKMCPHINPLEVHKSQQLLQKKKKKLYAHSPCVNPQNKLA